MLSDLEIGNLLMQQYNAAQGVFDYQNRIENVSFGVKHYDDCSIVCCEGSYNFPDWWSNFEAEMIQVDIGGVEKGFYTGIPDVMTLLLTMLPKDKPVYCAGHSRGSAHADLIAAYLIKADYTVFIVVFGSPRAGDHVFATILAQGLRRAYKNRNDPVTCVPEPLLIPYWPYIHPTAFIMVNVEPDTLDPWGLLADHHFELYLEALNASDSISSTTKP